jgi:N-acetylmuramoyl-L-alanine amidase
LRREPAHLAGRFRRAAGVLLGVALSAVASAASAASCGSPPVVTLDIGHTPERPGAMSARGRTEYSFNRDLALDLEAALRATKAEVRLLNEQGDEISLTSRASQFGAIKLGIVISLHHDSAQARFLERGLIDGKTATFTRYPKARGYSIFVSGRSASFAASESLARAIGGALRQAGFKPSSHHADPIKGENRPFLDETLGVLRYDGLLVLRSARVPAVLFERGVIVNPEEELELESAARKARVVAALVNGISDFCRQAP